MSLSVNFEHLSSSYTNSRCTTSKTLPPPTAPLSETREFVKFNLNEPQGLMIVAKKFSEMTDTKKKKTYAVAVWTAMRLNPVSLQCWRDRSTSSSIICGDEGTPFFGQPRRWNWVTDTNESLCIDQHRNMLCNYHKHSMCQFPYKNIYNLTHFLFST